MPLWGRRKKTIKIDTPGRKIRLASRPRITHRLRRSTGADYRQSSGQSSGNQALRYPSDTSPRARSGTKALPPRTTDSRRAWQSERSQREQTPRAALTQRPRSRDSVCANGLRDRKHRRPRAQLHDDADCDRRVPCHGGRASVLSLYCLTSPVRPVPDAPCGDSAFARLSISVPGLLPGAPIAAGSSTVCPACPGCACVPL